MAPNVNLINLQVLDQNGSGTDSNVIAAIDEAISLKSTYNIRVINLSLGQPVYESYTVDPLCQAAEAAWSSGIVVVVAAGNSGRNAQGSLPLYGTIASPGNDPYVITVGATNTHGSTNVAGDTIASYSSDGPTAIDHIAKPDLVAPGNNVVSLMAPNNTLANYLSFHSDRPTPITNRAIRRALHQVLLLERNQHGHAGGERRRRAADPEVSIADPGPSEGPADEDRLQELLALQQRAGQGPPYHLQQHLGHLHHRRRAR